MASNRIDPAPPLWILSLTTTIGFADIVEEILGDAPKTLTLLPVADADALKIEAIYDAMPSLPALNSQISIAAMLHEVELPQLTLAPVGNLDWLKQVEADFAPLKLARWTVHGSAYRNDVSNRTYALEINATRAFGRGDHPTTNGCLLLLDDYLRTNKNKAKTMLDVGSGTGVLAMAFAQATKGVAIGVDLDPVAVAIAQENVHQNNLQNHVRIVYGNGYRAKEVRQAKPFDLIMANIFASPLCQLAPQLKQHLRLGGTAILAGLLNHQANRVIAAHRMQGLFLEKRLTLGAWTILALKRKNG